MIDNFLTLFEQIFGNNYSLLAFISISFLIKGYLFVYLSIKGIFSVSKIHRPVPLLLLVLLSVLIQDSSWIATLIKDIISPDEPSLYLSIWIVFSWGFPVIQYQALALFLESLAANRERFSWRQRFTSFISIGFSLYFLIAGALKAFGVSNSYFHRVQEICVLYCIFILMPLSIINVFLKMKRTTVPEILKKQLLIILKFFIYPQLFCDFIQLYPFKFVSDSNLASSYGVVGFSAILLACALYYCTRRIIALRFLNIKEHVEAADRFNFVNSFKDVLEQFSSVTNTKELGYITQTFFKENFNIPLSKIQVHVRNDAKKESSFSGRTELSTTEVVSETFITTHYQNSMSKTEEVLIFDEIAFNSFYAATEYNHRELSFLERINADIFLPIFKNDAVIAYILIERHARPKEFYSTGERDEMVIFAHYLGNMIHLLKSRQLETIIQQEKELKEEIYNKHQEINQYKESIRSFLRNKPKEIGILFYKSRKFIFGNQTAQELLKVNPNTQEGHPFVKAIKHIATTVEEYKSPQNTIYTESSDQKYVISGVLNIEKNNVIITIYPPDISDIIKRQFGSLKDPSKWDYLLYLETTQSGQLINQMIPGTGETILNFKIDLLKIALSKKAILIDMPQEDTLSIVEVLHHISLRETLHVLHIKGPSSNAENAIKLFGINPIFSMNKDTQPLLEKLNNVGTLFIENIHLLELETQENLAEYLQYGMFRVYKSDQKKEANVRIICSTNQDLVYLAQQGKFSNNLLIELKKTHIKFPSLHELSEQELSELTEGFSHGMLQNQPYSSLLELTNKEKNRLIESRPVSFKELKQRVQQIMLNKSKRNEIEHETHFDPAFDISNPELVQAARLGKHALRDKRVLTMLWNKFKNQNKIAAFLGVNRSSVNRRCKEFKLE